MDNTTYLSLRIRKKMKILKLLNLQKGSDFYFININYSSFIEINEK